MTSVLPTSTSGFFGVITISFSLACTLIETESRGLPSGVAAVIFTMPVPGPTRAMPPGSIFTSESFDELQTALPV